jgi:PKD repeat protein
MASLPTIYCIHSSDAAQHFGKIEQLTQKFREQNRASGFVQIDAEKVDEALLQKVEGQDLVVVLLTNGLEQKQAALGRILSQLKTKFPDLPIAEILIDNIQYEKEYITLPADLKPIRDRQDKEQVWAGIETTIEQLIPRSKPLPLKKVLIGVAAVLVIGLLVWALPKLLSSNLKPDFSIKIMDNKSADIISGKTYCYLPCVLILDNNSPDSASFIWDLGDTTLTGRDLKYVFLQPGKHDIKLTAVKGKKEKSISKSILAKAPPIADFDAMDDGCKVPCTITFSNKSGDVKTVLWNFGDSTSSEVNPKKKYNVAGEYNVSLKVTNEDGMEADTVKKVTIRMDDSPYAEFSIKKIGPNPLLTRTVNFENHSKNATEYIWKFGDGTPRVEEASPTHTYAAIGQYTVELIAKKGNLTTVTSKPISIGTRWHWVSPEVKKAISKTHLPKATTRELREYRIVKP